MATPDNVIRLVEVRLVAPSDRALAEAENRCSLRARLDQDNLLAESWTAATRDEPNDDPYERSVGVYTIADLEHDSGITIWVKLARAGAPAASRRLGHLRVVATARRPDDTTVQGESKPKLLTERELGDHIPIKLKLETSQVRVDRDNFDLAWSFRPRGSRRRPSPLATSKHRFYTILAEPQAPWLATRKPDDARSLRLPWIEVLDRACRWSAGARDDPAGAAGAIARELRRQCDGRFCYQTGQSHYVPQGVGNSNGELRLKEFLERLGGAERPVGGDTD